MRTSSSFIAKSALLAALLAAPGSAAWSQHLVFRDSLPNAPQAQPVAAITQPDAPQPDADQDSNQDQAQQSSSSTQTTTTQQTTTQTQMSQHDQAEQDVKAQEKQRVMGLLPMFNVTNNGKAVPLSSKQKFDLAWHSAIDPAAFVIAGIDAGISQAENDFSGYGQGAQGYAKRYGAAYADSFIGTMLSNGVLPSLLKQDPRYFRMGHAQFRDKQVSGSKEFWIRSRYAISTTFRAKSDTTGKWEFNYSNIGGNLIGGGISNLYYDEQDRGVGLTFQRFGTSILEGMVGAMFLEFWPDVHNHIRKKKEDGDATPSLHGTYRETHSGSE